MRAISCARLGALTFLAGLSLHTMPADALQQQGRASWYAMTTKTASGERANPNAMVAAHRSLPFGSCVEVKHLGNGRSVKVRINDRGPFIKGRIIDVSRLAASKLGFIASGTAPVRIRTMQKSQCRAS